MQWEQDWARPILGACICQSVKLKSSPKHLNILSEIMIYENNCQFFLFNSKLSWLNRIVAQIFLVTKSNSTDLWFYDCLFYSYLMNLLTMIRKSLYLVSIGIMSLTLTSAISSEFWICSNLFTRVTLIPWLLQRWPSNRSVSCPLPGPPTYQCSSAAYA